MKKYIVLVIICCGLISLKADAQYSFGICPGLNLNSAYVGYKLNKSFTLLGAFQYYNLNGGLTYTQEGGNGGTNDQSASISFFVPSVGLRARVYNKETINGFFFAQLAKPFLTSKILSNGVEQVEIQDQINHISTFAGNIGYGMEYFISEEFSLTGEFGLNFIHFDYKNTERGEEYNSNTNQYETVTYHTSAKLNFNPTFSRIGFNFYFN